VGVVRKLAVLLIIIVPVLLSAQNLGLGAVIGSPTGLSLKYILAKQSAFSAHAGWSFIGTRGVHLTGDYQYLFPMVIETAEGASISDLTPYIATGGRFRFKEEEGTDESEFHLGLRIGGGVEYVVSKLGIFLELVPVVDLIPETVMDFEYGLGFLFYF
jgi:hypothetical protein